MPTDVYLERGGKRVFACALDWPGWCRSAKTDDLALETLAGYRSRYAVVPERAGMAFSPGTLRVVERLAGSGATDFGVPHEVPAADARPVSAAQARRLAALVSAAWEVFDAVVADAPAELRKGPRGGGRDRDQIVGHVSGAELAYARKIGIRSPDGLREAIAGVLGRPSDGSPLAPKGWPLRYAARRIAWHVLDHAWEIEDKS